MNAFIALARGFMLHKIMLQSFITICLLHYFSLNIFALHPPTHFTHSPIHQLVLHNHPAFPPPPSFNDAESKKESKSSKLSPTKSYARNTLDNSKPFMTNSWTEFGYSSVVVAAPAVVAAAKLSTGGDRGVDRQRLVEEDDDATPQPLPA